MAQRAQIRPKSGQNQTKIRPERAKLRPLMAKGGDGQTDGRTEGRTDGCMEIPPVSYRTSALWGCCPTLTSLLRCQNCLPTSNATVEQLFSVVGVIKTKLRNRLAIYMVEGILAT